MRKVIEKADVLIEALPYIQRFRDAIIVVKFGGSAMEIREHCESILQDVAFMECAGMLPVIVHGGGKAISRAMKEKGIEPRFLKGLRVTCERSIQVVREVMNTSINPDIVATLRKHGARAEGLHGEDIFTAVRMKEKDEATGQELDLGFVGEPVAVDTGPIRELLGKGAIPVITPLGRGTDGFVYNVNADTAALSVAKALKARKLAYLSDVPGLLRDVNDPESLIGTLRQGDVETLIARGVISGGMLPKVRSATEALQAGVKKVHMIDGRMPHSLLLEIFTDKGVGTEIVGDE
jgi:acetylglutamate kinase